MRKRGRKRRKDGRGRCGRRRNRRMKKSVDIINFCFDFQNF
jgi:hypothetical protein